MTTRLETTVELYKEQLVESKKLLKEKVTEVTDGIDLASQLLVADRRRQAEYQGASTSGVRHPTKCFTCGQFGHVSRTCTNKQG